MEKKFRNEYGTLGIVWVARLLRTYIFDIKYVDFSVLNNIDKQNKE